MKSAPLAAALLAVLALGSSAALEKKQDQSRAAMARGLAALGVSRSDWDEIPSRWPAPMAAPEIEMLLSHPLEIPARSRSWGGALDADESVYAALGTARRLLSVSAQPAAVRVESSLPEGVIRRVSRRGASPRLLEALGRIYDAVATAQVLINETVDSLPPADRAAALDFFKAVLTDRPAVRPQPAYYAAAAKFDRAALFTAAAGVAENVEREIPVLQEEADRMRKFPRMRWDLPEGALVLSGAASDKYGPADLSAAALIIDFGNGDVYRGPAAAAGPGQIRVIIDLGKNAVVDSSGAAAGSGVLGVGMMFLPASGRVTISAGDFSAGAGLFGVGALEVEGGSLKIKSGSFSQGAGAFGAGVFLSSGAGSDLSADFAAQGFGFSNGAGLFRLRGDGARLSCGFAEPDGHEDKAFLSLCQGVGYGPRAFAAGGVGLAVLDGSGARLDSSYNAQGSGYWHGFGELAIFGNENHLLARRYGQGSGIHMAVGSLSIKGSGNTVENWGVGPAFGWDRGIGNLLVEGDSNTLYSQWASASAQVNGEALVKVSGNGNVLELPDFGFGAAGRDGPSYVLADIAGEGNVLQESWTPGTVRGSAALRFGPWGAAIVSGNLIIGPGTAHAAPIWPENPALRARSADRERIAAEKILAGAGESHPDALKDCLFVLASANLDGTAAARAMLRLLSFGPREAARLPALLSPENFDELLWIRLAAEAQGKRLAAEDLRALRGARGLKKVLLLDLLGFAPSEPAWAAVFRTLKTDPDWRARAQAAVVLGHWLDEEPGNEMGRLGLLRLAREVAISTGPLTALEADELGRRTIGDYYSVLSLDPAFSLADEESLAFKASNPFDSAGGPAAAEFARQVRARAARDVPEFQHEIRASLLQKKRSRRALLRALRDPSQNVRAAALLALGGIGYSRDAAELSRFLDARRAQVRVAAAFALGKMGPAAAAEISRLLESGSRAQKVGASLAAAHSWDPRVFLLLRRALLDPDREVRLSAVADLSIATYPALQARKKFVPLLIRMESGDSSPEVRRAAVRAVSEIGR
ncbi:MAG TPA: HEAT repeat domain-containing protein [Elusimicrobiota bacterium]|nr:HEAT repeat domain-containing protein [Elusimicrobiota bacterium]